MRFIALATGIALLPLWALGAPQNQAPTITPVPTQTVNENQEIIINIVATDPEGDTITLTAANLPANATLINTGNGTANLEFNPDFEQAGDFTVTITATDNGDPVGSTSLDVDISVVNVNRLPIINAQAALEVTVGQTGSVSFNAADPDGDVVNFIGVNLPGNMTVTNNGNSSAEIEYTPSESEVGSTTVTINADDGNAIFPISLDVVVNPLPDEGCSVSHSPSSSTMVFWTLLVGALLLQRRREE